MPTRLLERHPNGQAGRLDRTLFLAGLELRTGRVALVVATVIRKSRTLTCAPPPVPSSGAWHPDPASARTDRSADGPAGSAARATGRRRRRGGEQHQQNTERCASGCALRSRWFSRLASRADRWRDCPRARRADRSRSFRQASSAQITEGNAISSRGMRCQGNRATSRLSGPAAKRGDIGRGEAGAKDHLDLADAADAEHAENAVQHDLGLRLLPGFARGTLLERLAVFQIACGQGPEAAARFDRAATHQHGVAGDTTEPTTTFGILIGDVTAVGADQALAIIAFGNPDGRSPACSKVTLSPPPDQSRAADHPGTPTRAGHTDRSSSDPRGRAGHRRHRHQQRHHRGPVPKPRPLRRLQRHRPRRVLLRRTRRASPLPAWQSSTQPRHPHGRRLPTSASHTPKAAPTSTERSPTAKPRRRRYVSSNAGSPTPSSNSSPLDTKIAGPGRTPRERLQRQRDRLTP